MEPIFAAVSGRAAVSAPALRRVLSVMEPSRPLPLRAIAEETGLSPSTVARAVAELTAAGILTEEEGTDPVSGRPCRVIRPAPVALLPVLALSEAYGQVTVLDLAAHAPGTASVGSDPSLPPEESLRILCRRAMPLLRGCAKATGLSVTAPVLLTDRREALSTEAVSDTVGLPPLVTVSYGEAVAVALGHQPIPAEAVSLLHIHGGERQVSLLTRYGEEGWRLSPVGYRLTRSFRRYTADSIGPDALRRGTARFLKDLCSLLTIDCVLTEDPTGVLPSPEEVRLLLPDGTVPIPHKTDESSPSLAVLGAFTVGRRRLWEKILSGRER